MSAADLVCQERNFWMRRQAVEIAARDNARPQRPKGPETASANPGTNGLSGLDGKIPGSQRLGGGDATDRNWVPTTQSSNQSRIPENKHTRGDANWNALVCRVTGSGYRFFSASLRNSSGTEREIPNRHRAILSRYENYTHRPLEKFVQRCDHNYHNAHHRRMAAQPTRTGDPDVRELSPPN